MDAFRNPQTPFVRPVATSAPKAGSPGWKAFTEQRWANNHPNAGQGSTAPKTPAVTPTSTAMDAFRTAMQQLQASTPQVDQAAIYAPYRASEQITGQLGAGYQHAEQQAGAAAQQQYATGRDAAQQHAARFGISAGAGANPTALADNGTQALAQQTAAYQAAAPAATAQWQALLERTAGAKVGDAQLAREQGLTTARQTLATSLPGAIGNEEDRAFQRHTQGFNERLAETQLTAKQVADLRNYDLGVAKVNQSGKVAQTKAQQTAASNAERKRHDLATETVAQQKVAQGDQALAIKRRASTASAKGLKGIPAAVKALSGSSATGTKPVVANKMTFVADPNGVSAGGPPIVLPVKVGQQPKAPSGYLLAPNTAGIPVYGQAGSKKTSITPSQWDQQMRGLLAQNPGRSAEVKAFLGPRPKT